ncbi:MAG: hypothetical protein ACREJB_13385 [Planctomycetaceae bacterium]
MARFVRFKSSLRDPACPRPLGVFRAAGALQDSDRLDPWADNRIEDICHWFNVHLPVPRLDEEHWRAVFWFRSECRPMISRLWELVAILESNDVFTEIIHTNDPGEICYSDPQQVAAIPYRRRNTRRKSM